MPAFNNTCTTIHPISAVRLPKTSYPLFDALPKDLVAHGLLSRLQLEGVLYACTKHLQLLPNNTRAGFFIADGAGVGKGRQIAGIILDNYARGRRRHVWVCVLGCIFREALDKLGAYVVVVLYWDDAYILDIGHTRC